MDLSALDLQGGPVNYDDNNIFAKILRKEIPATIVYEDEHTLAFRDVNPRAPQHILVIPKGKYVSFYDYSEKASPEEMQAMNHTIRQIINDLDLAKHGFRILTNHGEDGGQEVFHYHVHIFGGRPLGPMLAPAETS